jgi:hypothetical protein
MKRISQNIKTMIITGGTIFILSIISSTIISIFFPSNIRIQAPTPIVAFIPAPSETPTIDFSMLMATPTQKPLEIINGITIGTYVQILGTGNSGLRFREQPGLQMITVFVSGESEVFEVRDGPRQADGKTWWYMVAPYDPNRNGWAVNDYLIPLNTPQP